MLLPFQSQHRFRLLTVIDLSPIAIAILGNITAIIVYVQEIRGHLYSIVQGITDHPGH